MTDNTELQRLMRVRRLGSRIAASLPTDLDREQPFQAYEYPPTCLNGSTTAPFCPRSCVGRRAVDGSKTAASNQPRAHTARPYPARIRGGCGHLRALDRFAAGALAAAHRPSLIGARTYHLVKRTRCTKECGHRAVAAAVKLIATET